MGISRLKRLLVEDLSRAFTFNELEKFCWMVQPDLDLYKLTGIPSNIGIPRKEAAKQAVDYFFQNNRFLQFLDLFIRSAKVGFKGEAVVFNNMKFIIHELIECGYRYNSELGKVVKIENQGKRNDWGFLEEGSPYNFCFASVDICGNSMLVRKYDSDLIRQTYDNFRTLVKQITEKYDGRIWSWEGDGGLLAFHIKDIVNQAILASIDILSAMPIFNATSNYIDDNIIVRIGINTGEVEYKKNVNMIHTDVITKARMIEKNHTRPMTISISDNSIQHVDAVIRTYFKNEYINGISVFNLKLPLLGVKFDLSH